MPTPSPDPTISVDVLTRSVTGVPGAVGVPPDDAELIAASLVEADRRGTHSHGVLRLPLYLGAVGTGSGLAILLELLAGPLAGGTMAAETTDMWADPSVRMGTGHLLWVVDPVGLHGDDTAIGRPGGLQRRLRETTPAQGVREVLSPGDVEQRNAAACAEHVPVPGSVLDDLAALAGSLGLPDPRSPEAASL